MPAKTMRGVYPILVTPFDEQSRVDTDSLQNLVEFQIEAGVHGLGIALGSEVVKLTEAERVQVTRTVVGQAHGRVPIVVNVGGAGTDLALHYSRLAEESGADALMLLPPSFMPTGSAGLREYFKAVSDATSLPIFIQDTSTAHVPADLAVQIARESGNVRYIKVESSPTPAMVAETAAKAAGLLTIFGGAGGTFFIEEMRRGSVGTMPGCSNPEAFVQVWDQFQRGDERGARETFYARILPINRVAEQGWSAFYHVHKEILRQRGAIRTAKVRGPVSPLDDATRRDLQEVIDQLYPA
jgi:dihydrodipicolinate synthase/N-acetylneuraminate lyase